MALSREHFALLLSYFAVFAPNCTEKGIVSPSAVHNNNKTVGRNAMSFFVRFLTGFFVGLVLAGLLAALFLGILFC